MLGPKAQVGLTRRQPLRGDSPAPRRHRPNRWLPPIQARGAGEGGREYGVQGVYLPNKENGACEGDRLHSSGGTHLLCPPDPRRIEVMIRNCGVCDGVLILRMTE